MKTRLIILTIFILTFHFTFGQKIKTPKDIAEAISILTTDCPDSLKALIIKTGNDSLIYLCYPWQYDYETIFKWTESNNKRSKIRKYLLNKGLAFNQHQQTVILIAFKYHLSGQTINEDEIIKPFKLIEEKWREEEKVRFTTDSIQGIYIPKNLEDCFNQINGFWSDSIKWQVKQWTEEEFAANAHFGFGMWMRNNWQLWGGSRLSKYFNDMGVFHPDDMSGIILDSYHRYLTGKDIKLDEQIKVYQDYWKKNSKNPKKKK